MATAAPAQLATPTAGRMRRLWHSPDARPLTVLVLLPVVIFALPAATGHPAISQDNLLQNFPLRVLSGTQIRQGHLPLWNPTIWSGSPLLDGLNAGSFYPLTMLFVFLPAVLAWVFNLIGVYWAAGLGMYALLRQWRLRPLACLLAGLTYQFGGAMTGQLVHLGIIQGLGWMPLIVLAELRLSWAVLGTGPSPEYGSRPGSGRSPWPWVALLAGLLGLILLTGEPRAMAQTEIVASVVMAWLLLRGYPGEGVDPSRRLRLLLFTLVAGVWAAALGAAQLLPGRSFILASQRATESYAFFGLGSLRPSWTILMLVPNLFGGGNNAFGQPGFSIGYNLPEVTGYMGLLPLAGFLTLLVRSVGKGSDPRARDWRPWLFLAGLGLLLASGTFTPLGHLFAQIPFYNKVRLQSRNLGIVDLALAILFGFFLELFFAGEWRERTARPLRFLRETVVPQVFPVAGLAAAVTMLCVPATVLVAFGASPVYASERRPWMAAQAVVAAGAVAVIWAWRHWPAVRARRLLCAVVVADLGLFVLTCSTGQWAGGTPQPTRAQSAKVVGITGRFAVIDAPDLAALSTISFPDINGLTNLDSVQGYGSISSGHYSDVTGTHDIATMDACALARGVFVPLRLATLLVLPGSLVERLAPGVRPSEPAACPGAAPPGTPSSRTFYLGRELQVASVALVASGGETRAPPDVGILVPGGAVEVPPQLARRQGSGWVVHLAGAPEATAIVLTGPGARSWQETSVVTTTSGVRYAPNGPFQEALGEVSWHPRGFWAGYARFTSTNLGPRVAVLGVAGATARRISVSTSGSETDVVDTPTSALAIRSEAYLAGWSVQATPLNGPGPTRTLPVVQVGVIQGVRVPAGRWRLTYTYWPSGLTSGGVITALAVAALVGLVLWRMVVARRRRLGPGRAH